MQNWLSAFAHMEKEDHCGVDAPLARVREFSVRSGTENETWASVGRCLLRCTNSRAGGLVPPTLVDTPCVCGAMVPGIVNFDLLCMGQNEVTQGTDGKDG